jgi:hypothetical protein
MNEDQETTMDEVDEDRGYVPGSVIPAIIDNGEWAASFGLSWTAMMLFDQANSGRILRPGGQYFRKVSGTMGVAAARSEAAEYFLKSDAEWLFMVDTDMGFDPDVVDQMVASAVANDVLVLGGLCFAQKVDTEQNQGPQYAIRYRIQPTIYRYVEIEATGERGFQSLTKYKRDTFQHVAATGAALLLIHRDALTAVGPQPFMPITDATGGGNGTPRTFSEDLSFCVRVQGAGLEMGVDTSIKTTHYKGGIFLDEVAFAMQQETLIQARGHAIARQAELYTRAGLVVPKGVAL